MNYAIFRSEPIYTLNDLAQIGSHNKREKKAYNSNPDIDLDNGIINVKHSVYDKPKDKFGRWFIGSTKTESGKRKIYIGETLNIALSNYKELKERLKELYGKDYKYYHIEEVKNDYGKVIENRIVLNKNC